MIGLRSLVWTTQFGLVRLVLAAGHFGLVGPFVLVLAAGLVDDEQEQEVG